MLIEILDNMVIYGAEAPSFVGGGKTEEKPEGMSLADAEEFFEKYKKGLPTLFNYQARLKARCRKDGVVYTYFGFPRRVKYYFEQRGQKGYGERTILNHPIQGTAGDVLKIVMCKLWYNILSKDEYWNDVRFLTTVHDEINYGIHKDRLVEIARLLETTMQFDIAEWEVPLTVECSFGYSWGSIFVFRYDEESNMYVPGI